jgi:fibronectin type 3 domain-containing protein
MKIRGFLIVFFAQITALLLCQSFAQKRLHVFSLINPTSTVLRWNYPGSVVPRNGFKVYRTYAGQQSIILVPSPQPKEIVLNNGLLTQKEYGALQIFTIQPRIPREQITQGLMELQLYLNPKLARGLGVLIEDKGLKIGGTYTYRIVAVENGKETEIGSSTVTTGPTLPLSVPKQLKSILSTDRARIQFSKSNNPNSPIIAFRIYRSEGQGAFTLLEPSPFIPGDSDSQTVFEDTSVKRDGAYRYAITAMDVFGRESARSEVVTVNMRASQPLNILNINTLKPGNKEVVLTWPKFLDTRVKSVVILRGTDINKPLQVVSKVNTASNSFTDKGLQGGITYFYALQLEGALGEPSIPGPMRSVRATNTTAPTTPTGLTIKSQPDSLELTWKRNPENDLWGYNVLRAESETAAISGYTLMNGTPLTEPRFTDQLPPGLPSRFFYRVIAVNTSNLHSQASELAGANLTDQTPPNTPTIVNASSLEGAIGIAWMLPATPDLVKYEIYRIGPERPKPLLVAVVNAKTIGYVDKKVIPNLQYQYVVVAVDKSGNRSGISNVMGAKAVLTKPPPMPRGFKASISKDGVKLEWAKLKVYVYCVVYRLDGENLIEIAGPVEGSSFVDTNGKAGSRYVIKAIDLSANLSEPTAAIQAK